MIENQYGFSKDAVTVTQVVANLGALTGGIMCGWASQIFGRRFTIIVMCIVGGALLYPYTLWVHRVYIYHAGCLDWNGPSVHHMVRPIPKGHRQILVRCCGCSPCQPDEAPRGTDAHFQKVVSDGVGAGG